MSTQIHDTGGPIGPGPTVIQNNTGSSLLIFSGSQWERLGQHIAPESWSWHADPVDETSIEQDWIKANPKMPTRVEATVHLARMTPTVTRLVFGLSQREERIMRGVERKQLIHKGGKP